MTDPYEGPERRRVAAGPGIVTTWSHVVSTLGFPIVVALILLGMMTGYVPSPITQTAAAMQQHVRNEEGRSKILRVMCRHQAFALKQNPDDCDR